MFQQIGEFVGGIVSTLFGSKENTMATGTLGVTVTALLTTYLHMAQGPATALVLTLGGGILALIHAHGKVEVQVAVGELKGSALTLACSYLGTKGIQVTPDQLSAELATKSAFISAFKTAAVEEVTKVVSAEIAKVPSQNNGSALPPSAVVIPTKKDDSAPASVTSPSPQV